MFRRLDGPRRSAEVLHTASINVATALLGLCSDGARRRSARAQERLRQFLGINSGSRIPLRWPPTYVLTLGDSAYFGLCRDEMRCRRFACARDPWFLTIGFSCPRDSPPDTSSDVRILLSSRGRVLGYVASEDRMYVLSDSIDGFFERGLGSVYSLAERDFTRDPGKEAAWYSVALANLVAEFAGRDADQVLALADGYRGMSVLLGGSVRCPFTFCAAGDLSGMARQTTRASGLRVFGRLELVDRVVLLDKCGRVYAALSSSRVVKLAETVKGFFRHGPVWFTFTRRYCFPPENRFELTVGTQVNVSDGSVPPETATSSSPSPASSEDSAGAL